VEYYNDKVNESAAKVLFMLFQMVMILIVYGFVYTAFLGVKLAIEKYGLNALAYVPEIFATLLYPVVLYRTRSIFNKGGRLRAVAWCMGWASVIIVALYVHLDNLVSL